jgi:tetratricopeptide (TPR) repeat protein
LSEQIPPEVDKRVQRWLKGEIGTGELYQLTPDLLLSIAEYGYLLYEQGKYDTAKTIFEALTAIDSNHPHYQKILGAIYQIQGKWDAAYYRYSQSLRVVPTDIFVIANRGEVLLKLQRQNEAIEDFKQAILLDPENRNPAARRARVLMQGLRTR